MTLKKFSIIGLIIGALALLAGFGTPALTVLLPELSGDIGIVGGADLPTFSFAFWSSGVFVLLATFGVTLVLISIFCLAFPKFIRENCGIKTTVLSLLISAVGCMGLLCLIEFLAIVSFGGTKRHPIAYPATIAVGILCLVLFLTLFVLYCIARKGETRILGVVFDVFTGGMFMLFFLLSEAGAIELARDVYHMLERLW